MPFDTVENESNELLIGPNQANINMYIETRSRNNNDLFHYKRVTLGFTFYCCKKIKKPNVKKKLTVETATD